MLRRDFLLGAGVFGSAQIALSSGTRRPGPMTRTHRGRRWTCYPVTPARQSLGLFLSGDDGLPLRNFAALERHLAKSGRRLVLGMNAGMFEDDGSPVGWCVVDGKTIKGPNTNTGAGNFFLKPNGVFAIQAGKALVRETQAAVKTLDKATLVTQSGPLLVTAGQLHPAFRENSANRNIRNAVGVDAAGLVWLAISEEPVNFHESTTVFRDELGCADALFLDGVISQLHTPGLGPKRAAAALGPLLAVTEVAA